MTRTRVLSWCVGGGCRHALTLSVVGVLCVGLAGVRAQQRPTFRSGVDVVLIDVTVRNVNLPTLVLRFLDPSYQAKTFFRKG